MSDTELHTEKYIIGYIDLLGSTAKILEDNEDKWLNVVSKLYNDAWKQAEELRKIYTHEKPFIKVFSDNILIAEKLPEDYANKSNSIYRILYFLSYIQAHALIDYQWLVRGCVAIGDLYVNDYDTAISKSFIWGKGLIHVHTTETKVAFYPRIIADKTLLTSPNYIDISRYIVLDRFVLEDKDGLYYLNYLETYIEEGHMHEDRLVIDKAFEAVLEMSEQYKENIPISQKIAWTKDYLNLVKSDYEYVHNSFGPYRYLSGNRFSGKEAWERLKKSKSIWKREVIPREEMPDNFNRTDVVE